MNNQVRLELSLFLIVICTLMIGLASLHTVGIYAQNNITSAVNQTGNQTGNQSLSAAIPGQQGGTPPKTGPS
jgi:hypothetical protein